MKLHPIFGCVAGVLALVGCASCPGPTANKTDPHPEDALTPLLEKPFVFAVLEHAYRWHFDQSSVLESGKLDTLEVWARRLHPRLDAGDRSEFAELWIPAVNTRVELKRSDYLISEMNLAVVDRSFKIKRVTRELHPPAARSKYQVGLYGLAEVREHLFATRADKLPLSDTLRTAAWKLIFEYLDKAHPAPFTEDQVLYVAPVSSVCNDLWAVWESGRKIMLFSADMDLSNSGFSQLSQLRLDVIDLDKDVVVSTREVPGSNVFVTKDWVGRLFFNCILYGERLVRTPEEMSRLRSEASAKPTQ